jgi:hypothetical protein
MLYSDIGPCEGHQKEHKMSKGDLNQQSTDDLASRLVAQSQMGESASSVVYGLITETDLTRDDIVEFLTGMVDEMMSDRELYRRILSGDLDDKAGGILCGDD